MHSMEFRVETCGQVYWLQAVEYVRDSGQGTSISMVGCLKMVQIAHVMSLAL